MAVVNRKEEKKRLEHQYLSPTISPSTLEIVLDEQSLSLSGDEDSNDQTRESKAGSTSNESSSCRRKKQLALRDPKSHRLIEKRRRDRMNACLTELLELTPHETLDGQRRIEKTEIIEMAIKHIRHLISVSEKKSKTKDGNLEAYRTGYGNGLFDIYEFLDNNTDSSELPIALNKYFREKESDLQTLTVMPDKKRPKYIDIPSKHIKSSSTSKDDITPSNRLDKADQQLSVISEVTECPQSIQQRNSAQQSSPQTKVPIFALHPSGTHYIPMCIDASVVLHAFKQNSTLSRSSSTTDQAQCHPVSIPVNFHPITAFSDSYELDIQNINVIGTRHQTSVRPN